MASRPYDIAIIGGGIVGLATALALTRRYRRYRIVVIEKEPKVASHQTGHNSGVIHSGIYYRPGSLKAKLCREGAQKLIRFAEENNLSYELCGKVIVATAQNELPRLLALWERGLSNGISGLTLVNASQLRELEPHANGLQGIHSSKTGIIDYQAVAEAVAKHSIANGVEILVDTKVIGIIRADAGLSVRTTTDSLLTRFVINCGGLHADTIARMMGIEPEVCIIPFRGEYYMIRKNKRYLVRNLLYPVPSPDLPFLGVHFTRTIQDELEAGPNAVLAFAREGYHWTNVDFSHLLGMLIYRGFWMMGMKHWKSGIHEFYRSMSKHAFTQALRRLVPQIQESDLVASFAGVRAQCVDRNGVLLDDFKIVAGYNSIHVLNVPSPAATASLAIGEHIVGLAANAFGL